MAISPVRIAFKIRAADEKEISLARLDLKVDRVNRQLLLAMWPNQVFDRAG
jgi:hypothetical protein